MQERLRASAAAIRDAERRATFGELARQVNHDIKNGLTPLRNVFRHLAQLAREEPDRLAAVFRDRQGTVDSSMVYLEDLASNYARLSPMRERQICDVNRVVLRAVADRASGRVAIRTSLAEGATVVGDVLSLRRVVENLVDNAIDSLENATGVVAVETVVDRLGDEKRVRVVVSDNGCGMTEEQKARMFDDFYTTKGNGTGLGLSIVRRLVLAYALVALGYLLWRFDVQTLPAEGCSPLLGIRPGAHLLVDRRSRRFREGEILLFRDGTGRLLLARVAQAPPGVEASERWVLTDNPACPGEDSKTLGAVPLDRCVARVLFAFAW